MKLYLNYFLQYLQTVDRDLQIAVAKNVADQVPHRCPVHLVQAGGNPWRGQLGHTISLSVFFQVFQCQLNAGHRWLVPELFLKRKINFNKNKYQAIEHWST